MLAMAANKPDPPRTEEDAPVEGNQIEELFQRLPGSFHWPKPNAEAVAAAVEAIHRISGGAASDLADPGESAGPRDGGDPGDAVDECSSCGGALPASARFCVWCGIATHPPTGEAAVPLQAGAGQHHIHHHYHHIVPAQGRVSVAPRAEAGSTAPRGRAPASASSGSTGSSTGGRAEAGARQVVKDWAHACNTKHIDDLLELYAADATVIRSSIPPVRSLPAIREFLVSVLEAGLGDVEMESLRLEVMGEIALDLGRCKMLVPVAMGKRREERGKYMVVLARQPSGTWKILADCWSSDLAVNAPPSPDLTAQKGNEPAPHLRKPR